MKFELDTRELQFWWIKFRHLEILRFIRFVRTVYFEIVEYTDRSPNFEKGEDFRDWLKRVPSRYSERTSKYLYEQMRSYYIEVRKRMFIFDYENMDKKNKKRYKKLFDDVRTELSQAEEQYKEVLIRKN